MWPNVWFGDLHVYKSMLIGLHDTECPYWDQVSLNHTNQTPIRKVMDTHKLAEGKMLNCNDMYYV